MDQKGRRIEVLWDGAEFVILDEVANSARFITPEEMAELYKKLAGRLQDDAY
jgi:hypothetical protein